MDYMIVRSNRKTIAITVDNNGKIFVKVPTRYPKYKIDEIIKEKEKWLMEKQELIRKRESEMIQHSYINGEVFKYLGKDYKLKMNINKNLKKETIEVEEDSLVIYINTYDKDKLRTIIANWYIIMAKEFFIILCEKYKKLLDVKYNKITFKDTKTRFGSCSSRGNLMFNWNVIMAPKEIVEYLVIHEMCHLVYLNHSKEYWSLVKKLDMKYKDHDKWLKDNGHLLKLIPIIDN